MPMALDQLQNSVVSGQTELGKVAHMSHTAVAAVDCTKVRQIGGPVTFSPHLPILGCLPLNNITVGDMSLYE
jgi:hypothetical protein